MIRWSYLLPRLIVLVAILLVLSFGVPELIRWSVVRGVQRITGAAVEIDRVWISPARGKIRVDDIRIARSHASDSNMVEFQSATLKLDRRALAHRRYVVDKAEVHGLRFDTAREATNPHESKFGIQFGELRGYGKSADELGDLLFASLKSDLVRRFEEEFESVQLTRQLCQYWPVEFDRFADQVRGVRLSGQRLSDQLRGRDLIPTGRRQLETLQTAWAEAKDLHVQINGLNAELGRLVDQAAQDRESVAVVFSRDRETLRGKIAKAQLDPQIWHDYLLAGEVRRWQGQIRPWIRLVGWLTGQPVFNEAGRRGTVIPLDYERFPDDLLVRSASVDGTIPFGDGGVQFFGRVKNLSRWPAHRPQPCSIHLVVGADRNAILDIELGLAGGAVRRWVRLRCRGIQADQRTWGDPDTMAVTFAPGTADLEIEIEMLDDQITGRIHLQQRHVGCSIVTGSESVGSTPAGAEFLRCVTAAVENIDSMQLAIGLSGTIDAPEWKIDSDLPRQFLPDVRLAVQNAMRVHAEQMDEAARTAIIAKLADLEAQLSERQVKMIDQLGEGEQLLSLLGKPITARLGSASRFLGGKR